MDEKTIVQSLEQNLAMFLSFVIDGTELHYLVSDEKLDII